MAGDAATTSKLSEGYRRVIPGPGDGDARKRGGAEEADDARKGWFAMAHLILDPGAHVADMGCGAGGTTRAMAALNPHIRFTGVDHDRKLVARAKRDHVLPNLDFRGGDIADGAGFDPGSLDAVVDSFVLNRVYSAARYSDRAVAAALEAQFALLKTGGLMFVRDYAVYAPSEYVLMEMPDDPGGGGSVRDMSDADLLVWYSEHARPAFGKGGGGFFLEELPQRFPRTRLFRLPCKWAYEFMARKDSRETVEEDLASEYAFFTPGEFRAALGALGARVLYSAPHWDDAEVRPRFDPRFRLYGDDGAPLGPPPAGFVAVAQKVAERQSLFIREGRPSAQKGEPKLRVRALRNDITGKVCDVVSRDSDLTEIVPYRVTEKGELNVFVREGVPRGIVNAVPRGGREIDGKRWSGHMIEAVAVPTAAALEAAGGEVRETVLFARDWLGLKPFMGAALEKGPSFFPAPDFIDEHVKTFYLRVSETGAPVEPKNAADDIAGFSTAGRVREVSARAILDAVAVGFVPNARLELQILALCERLGLSAGGREGEESPVVLEKAEPEARLDAAVLTACLADGDKRFKDVRGTAGQLRSVRSVFIDEGRDGGAVSGMASCDLEFVVPEGAVLNKAVVLPLTLDLQGQVMAGLCTEFMPVPQRYKGNGMTVSAPCFPLPREIAGIEQVRLFIADKFGVSPDKVFRLGESYFCNAGVTPQRIFPFAVASSKSPETPVGGPVRFAPMKYIWSVLDKVLDWDIDFNLMSAMRKAQRRLGADSAQSLKWLQGRQNLYEAKTPGMASYTEAAAPDESKRLHMK